MLWGARGGRGAVAAPHQLRPAVAALPERDLDGRGRDDACAMARRSRVRGARERRRTSSSRGRRRDRVRERRGPQQRHRLRTLDGGPASSLLRVDEPLHSVKNLRLNTEQ